MTSHPHSWKERLHCQVLSLRLSLVQTLPPALRWSILVIGSSTVMHDVPLRALDSEKISCKQRQHKGPINVLPEDVLLELFTCYMDKARRDVDRWHTLIHVCRRWRVLVLASPRRLNLQLLCSIKRLVREMLDIWPALPIVISEVYDETERGTDNIIAALKHNDRIHEINLGHVPNQLLEEFAALAPEPFPVLTSLRLTSHRESPPVLPESFLGASVPSLRSLRFCGIPFPAVPTLLLSAHDLNYLELWNIPHSGYISPGAMITCLSTMTSLRRLRFRFRSPRSCPIRQRRRPLPLTRIVLPALTLLEFKDVSEYLEDLVSRIEAPALHIIYISFLNQLIFNIPQLSRFIDCHRKFEALNQANIVFSKNAIEVAVLDSESARTREKTRLALRISCSQPDWQLSSLAQICGSSFAPLATVERLDIHEDQDSRPRWPEDIEDTEWLELLQPFTSVRVLYISKTIVPCVAAALKELPLERVTGMMPGLQSILINGPRPLQTVLEAIEHFITTRQLITHPVTVYHRESGDWVATVSGSP